MRLRRMNERGAAAVEFALVLPLLVMLLVGTITSGVSYSRAIGATNAVREGARFGATADSSSPSWAADVVARVRATQLDDPDSETTICVRLVGGTPVGPYCSAGTPASPSFPSLPSGFTTGCVVQVVAARPYYINAIFHEWDRVVTKSSVARYERDTCA